MPGARRLFTLLIIALMTVSMVTGALPGGYTVAVPVYAEDGQVGEELAEPGDPATEEPGDPATEEPGDPATEEPGDLATEEPGDTVTEEPGDPSPETPANPEPDPEQETAEPEAPEVPLVPQVNIKVKGAGLKLSWSKLEGAKSYLVYRSYKKSKGFKLLKKGITKCSYKDKKVKSGKKAYYKVRARKADGSLTGYSEVVSGTIYRVFIETGHGWGDDGLWDSGCTWSGYQEAKLMVPICKSATRYLQEKGVYVYTDAFKKNNCNLNITLKKIKKLDVSVLLNVHCDYRFAPRGTMPLYRYSEQKKLAKCLNKGVHKYVKIKDRGLKKRYDLRTLNKTPDYCVACLFETGNIKKDNKILRTKYDAIGKGLAKGVCDYLGIDW